MVTKLLVADDGKTFYVKELSRDFHTQYGFVPAADLKKAKAGEVVTTNTGKELRVLEPSFIDLYKKITRGPQIITQKDIGGIIGDTGVGKESVVVDAGGGTGALTFFLAHICKKVVTYEIREDFSELLEKNKKFLGLKNITIKNKDVSLGITEKNVDLITLDLPEPWHVVEHAEKALRVGGYLIAYSPNITQIAQFLEAVSKRERLHHVKTKEIIERMWDTEGRKMRPQMGGLGHTGFLAFCRKI